VYRWVEHTGELELEIEGETEEEVYKEAMRAFAEVAGDAEGEPARTTIRVSAPDRARLLAEWIGELAFLAETDGLVPQAASELALEGDALTAVVSGVLGSPAHLVKAVTYHRLSFESDGGRWRARLVLDV
jgi:SHS2 domain-containing protein